MHANTPPPLPRMAIFSICIIKCNTDIKCSMWPLQRKLYLERIKLLLVKTGKYYLIQVNGTSCLMIVHTWNYDTVYYSVSQSMPSVHTSSLANVPYYESFIWLRFLASVMTSILDPHQDSSQLSCCCPVSWRSCSFGTEGPASSHVPPVCRWCRFWGGPTQHPGSGPEW